MIFKTKIEKSIRKTFRQIHFMQMGARDKTLADRRRVPYHEYTIPEIIENKIKQ